MLDDGYDFSLQRASRPSVVNHVRKHPDVATADVAASFQEAVVDVLVTKARRAARGRRRQGPGLGRGRGRQLAAARAARSTRAWPTACTAFLPSRAMCTDNAAMVAAAGLVAPAERRPVAARHGRQPEPAPAVLDADAGRRRPSRRRPGLSGGDGRVSLALVA